MLTIRFSDAHWIKRQPDPQDDQCAHGDIDVLLKGVSLLEPDVVARAKNRCASAAGLYLLRAIDDDHVEGTRVSNDQPLIPCCGHAPYITDAGNAYPVYLMGCPNGADISIRHDGGEVVIGEPHGATRVSKGAWRVAVLGFVRQVEAFYASCSPKVPPVDRVDAQAWAAFWSEWDALKERAQTAHP